MGGKAFFFETRTLRILHMTRKDLRRVRAGLLLGYANESNTVVIVIYPGTFEFNPSFDPSLHHRRYTMQRFDGMGGSMSLNLVAMGLAQRMG